MPQAVETDAPRLVELDGVRGFAALLVVYTHLFLTWVPAPNALVFWTRTMSGMAWTGVVLFFVLSGFLIGGNLMRHRDARNYFRVFYTRRAFRIFPLYYFLLAVYFFIRLGTSLGEKSAFMPQEIPLWSYPALVQNFFMAQTGNWGVGVLGVTWSVALEEQFYLFLPLLVRFTPAKWLFPSICLLAASGPFFRYYINNTLFLLGGSSEALFGGVMLAWLYRHRPQLFTLKIWLRVATGIFLCAGCGMALIAANRNFGIFQGTVIAVFWGAFLWIVLSVRQSAWMAVFRMPWLRGIGSISYGVYLFHTLVAHLVLQLVGKTDSVHAPGVHGFALTLVSFALVIGFAAVSFRFVEKRLIKIGQRHVYLA